MLGNKNKPHRFSTGILKGDKIILEYYQPAEEVEFPIIKVEKTFYTYIPAPYFLDTSTCSYEVNVNCSEGDNWQLEKNAVALVYCKNDNESGWGSGSLVNNTQNNLAPLFLTANHCVDPKDAIEDNDLSDWVFYWGYELESCSSTTQPSYINKTTVGATLVANNDSYSDFALLELQQDPLYLPGYIPYYLGWDASGNSGTGGVCIHHPNGDVKKISTYNSTPQTVAYHSSPSVYWGVQWIATINGHGITEIGSSGSPLINNSHFVIGQLRGGNSSCTNLFNIDKFGKFNVSWTGNGNSDYRRRLNYWLNPNGYNIQNLSGLNPYGVSGPSYIIQSTQSGVYSIDNLPSIYTVSWSLSDSYYNQNCLQQNYPSQNQCTITRSSSYNMMNATLTAEIKYNGVTIQTLTKTGIYAYNDFYGQYTSGNLSGTINYTHTFTVKPGYSTVVTSPNFIGATVSYDNIGTIPSNFYFEPTTWKLYFTMPTNNNGNPIVINVNDGCGNYYQLYALPLAYLYLEISNGNDEITVMLREEGDDSSKNLAIDQSWTVEVCNAVSGVVMTTRSSTDRSVSIPTSAWPKGVYVVKATVGKTELTEKVVIK